MTLLNHSTQTPKFRYRANCKLSKQRNIQQLALRTSLTILLLAGSLFGGLALRYGNKSLSNIPLTTDPVEQYNYQGKNLSFQPVQGTTFNVTFTLQDAKTATRLGLQNIDLSLMLPQAPATAQGKPALVAWFLTEREFNRQRVVFPAGSPHIQVPQQFAGYDASQISIALTNNCLGAGYWEVTVFAEESGNSKKLYQGYFNFPKGAYAQLVAQINDTAYLPQAQNLEAWPGFEFHEGRSFDLAALRMVQAEQTVQGSDRSAEVVFTQGEQAKKAKLMHYPASQPKPKTWQELRQANPQFQRFIKPGMYAPDKLRGSDFQQIAYLNKTIVRQIRSPLVDRPLTEIELQFMSDDRQTRRLVISGIDINQIPQLQVQQYNDGLYRPLGFGPTFTQDYATLQQNLPSANPLFSVVLDGDDRLIHYRKTIGINGLVMHRDAQNSQLLHLYLLSYERITLVGHYVIHLNR